MHPPALLGIRDSVDSADASENVVKRTTMVAQSWEGLDVLDNGVVIGGDELRPVFDNDGGTIYRFVPESLYNCSGAPLRPGQLCENTISHLDIQPHTSNVYIAEDFNTLFQAGGSGGDVWACLPDGGDRDKKTDGCVRMLSITDPNAEPSGFIFDGTGKVAYYHVQHGQQFDELLDFDSNKVNGYTDDLIKITGLKVKTNRPK